MGFLNRIFRSDPLNNPINFASPEAFLLFGGHRTDSNEVVTPHTAMMLPTVFRCVSIIAEQIATNSLLVYKAFPNGGKEIAFDHDYYNLVHNQPNPEQDAIQFRTAVQVSLLLWGNGYIELQRDNANRVVAMWHRHSHNTRPVRTPSGKLVYQTTDGESSEVRTIQAEDMIHLMGTTVDGFIGMSPIECARQSLGSNLAMDKFGARFFANNATPSLAITVPGLLKPEDKTKARSDWEALQTGQNHGRVAILDNGKTVTPLSISQADSQFIEGKQVTKREIASIFGVPGHMVGDQEKGIKANVEQQAQDFLTYCLQPWMDRWEKGLTTKLFSSMGRSAGKYFVQFNTRRLLRPDAASRTTYMQSGIQNGVLSINDAREMEDLNPIGPEGDYHYIQMNMQNLQTANLPVDSQPSDTELLDEEEENSLPLNKIAAQYRGLYRDGISRLLVDGTTRDTATVRRCLWPVLEAMSFPLIGESIVKPLENTSESYKAIAKLCDGIEHRAKTWTLETLDEIVATELKRSLKALTFAANRDKANVAAAKALKQLDVDESEDSDE
jgi:HK97 family phage portal protein